MNGTVQKKSFFSPPVSRKEILRYAGMVSEEGAVSELLSECLREAEDKLSYQICYRVLPVSISGKRVDLGEMTISSENLARNLSGCDRAVLFAATLGVGVDRLITKYTRLSPVKALLFQAIGTERIEALCDRFCHQIEEENQKKTRPRFSPGYGDVDLAVQREVFSALSPTKWIGLSLGENLIMSPSKSVTAFVGLVDEK